jgi:hypothetical protein
VRFEVWGENKGNRPLGIPKCRWDNIIKMDLQDVKWEGMD